MRGRSEAGSRDGDLESGSKRASRAVLKSPPGLVGLGQRQEEARERIRLPGRQGGRGSARIVRRGISQCPLSLGLGRLFQEPTTSAHFHRPIFDPPPAESAAKVADFMGGPRRRRCFRRDNGRMIQPRAITAAIRSVSVSLIHETATPPALERSRAGINRILAHRPLLSLIATNHSQYTLLLPDCQAAGCFHAAARARMEA